MGCCESRLNKNVSKKKDDTTISTVKECDDLYVTPDDGTCEDTIYDNFDHPTLIINEKVREISLS